MPTGRLVRQAVFDHQPHGQAHDPVGVVTLRQGKVGHIDVEVLPALGAVVDGVRKVDVVRATRDQIPQVVQHPLGPAMPIGAVPTSGTPPPSPIPTALNDLRLGQVLNPLDALGGIGQVFSRSWHSTALLGTALQAENLPEFVHRVIAKTQ
jgi:hypothetical protein